LRHLKAAYSCGQPLFGCPAPFSQGSSIKGEPCIPSLFTPVSTYPGGINAPLAFILRRQTMRTISNPTIEPANNSFVIEFVLFGTATKPATRKKVTVMAVTARGAKRIAKAQ